MNKLRVSRQFKNKEMYASNASKRVNSIPLMIEFLIIVIALIISNYSSPKINIIGKEIVDLNYGNTYKDEGYKAKYIDKDVTKEVHVRGKVDYKKIGTYKIEYKIKKGLHVTKKVRIINIVDKELPIITLSKENNITLCPNENYIEDGYTAYDNYDKDLTSKVKITKEKDKYIYTVKDSSNNKIKVVRNIIYKDIEKPNIILEGQNTIYLEKESLYIEKGFKVDDNCDKDLTTKVEIINNTDTSKPGTYNIIYKVKDSTGNITETSREVVVYEKGSYMNTSYNQNGVIYLTFDDGPSESITNAILDILKEEGIYATFFVTNYGPDSLIKREYQENHTVALHTATHYFSVYKSVDTYFEDLYNISNRVRRLTGIESKIMRFPGGSSNTVSKKYKIGIMTELTKEVQLRGFKYYDWNIDSDDANRCAKVSNKSNCVYKNVIDNLSKNRINIVLMHDTKYYTRDALRDIIRYAKANNYKFGKINKDTPMIRTRVFN